MDEMRKLGIQCGSVNLAEAFSSHLSSSIGYFAIEHQTLSTKRASQESTCKYSHNCAITCTEPKPGM
jgi:hypothetical protein